MLWRTALFITIATFVALIPSITKAQACYRSSISFPTPFMGNHEEIFKLQNGTLWQVQHEYEYMYEYHPDVTVCPRQSIIIVDSKEINVRQITNFIETSIDGEFEGWKGDTIFKLQNGQIWQQSSYKYEYHYSYSPKVILYQI